MAFIPRQVPWQSWEEWQVVKDGLYTPDSDPSFERRLVALDLVALWRSRGGGLPHSVEASATLAEVYLMDSVSSSGAATSTPGHSAHGGLTRVSEMALRLQYTLVVIRCVNGLVDPGQQGVFAESVLTLAQRRGIPAWVVEIRHDGTHNQLPPLGVLRSAATHLLNWYYTHYWEQQSAHLIQYKEHAGAAFTTELAAIRQALTGAEAGGGAAADLPALTWLNKACLPTSMAEIVLPAAEKVLFTKAGGGAKGTVAASKDAVAAFWQGGLGAICKGGLVQAGEVLHMLVCRLLCHAAAAAEALTARIAMSAHQSAAGSVGVFAAGASPANAIQTVHNWFSSMVQLEKKKEEVKSKRGIYGDEPYDGQGQGGYVLTAYARTSTALQALQESHIDSRSAILLTEILTNALLLCPAAATAASTFTTASTSTVQQEQEEEEDKEKREEEDEEEEEGTRGLWPTARPAKQPQPWPLGLEPGYLEPSHLHAWKVVSKV